MPRGRHSPPYGQRARLAEAGTFRPPERGCEGAGMARSADKAAAVADVLARFDHVIESSKVGIRKPDPRIYMMMCDTLAVPAADCVYLDDLGINCKPAATLGMHAIKVTGEAQALDDLAAALGVAPGLF